MRSNMPTVVFACVLCALAAPCRSVCAQGAVNVAAELAETKAKVTALEAQMKALTDQLRKLQAQVLDLTIENENLKAQLASKTRTGAPAADRPPANPAETLTSAAHLCRRVEAQLDAMKRANQAVSKEALDAWLAKEKLAGKGVLWTVVLDRASDREGQARLKELDDRVATAQGELVMAQVGIDRITLGTAEPSFYQKLGREKTLEQLQGRVETLQKEIPALMLEQWDAKTFSLRVTAHDPNDARAVVVADVHNEDLAALAKLEPGARVFLEGIIRGVRPPAAGTTGITVQLARCRVR